MRVITVDELAAFADGTLPLRNRAMVEREVAAAEVTCLLQSDAAHRIRTAAAQVEAPESLRRLIEQRRTRRPTRFQRDRLALGCAVTIGAFLAIVRRGR